MQRVSKYVVILHNREQYLFFLGIPDDEELGEVESSVCAAFRHFNLNQKANFEPILNHFLEDF